MTSNYGIRQRDPGLGAPNARGEALPSAPALRWQRSCLVPQVCQFGTVRRVIVVELGSDERLHQLQLCVARAAADYGAGEAVEERQIPRYAH